MKEEGGKGGKREMREMGGGGRRCLAVLPQQGSKQVCVCVHAWVFVSVSERDCDMEGWGLL